ncbi:hypothetical protein [Mucilaginibacter sp. SP1R1]|uniref:hypothetical protein n=1 Tax=Mucilaginibacter sp. SP1R1 TaxID=2723091 RepID=UPI00161D5641|nr:hypothetical protein [Mucilaginibacter sp. SP1R1]MBB6152041.1 hypothetical protein [Mucilaginibacter sp. SP1R1]
MDEQLDNDLNSRIREVFDNFDDPSYPSADEGWLMLREKFPEMEEVRPAEKKRPVTWLWWSSMAAAILLFIGIGLWVTDKKQHPETMAAKTKQHQEQSLTDSDKLLATKQTPVIKNNTANTATDSAAHSSAITAPANQLAQNTAATPATANKTPAYANTNAGTAQHLNNAGINPVKNNQLNDSINTAIAKANTQQHIVNAPAIANANTTITSQNNNPAAITQPAAKTTMQQHNTVNAPATANVNSTAVAQNNKPADANQPAAVVKTNTPQYAANPVTGFGKGVPANTANTPVTAGSSIMLQQTAKVTKPAPNSMAALFASEQPATKKPDEKYDEDRKVRFGVYAATFFNYAKGSNNQINAGAGFTSDIKLSKNIKLSTGLALAQNTLSYNSAPPVTADAVLKTQALVAYQQKDMLSVATAFPILKNYNANLVGLDIPLNLKYEFNPQKSDAYVSAGLSSGTFINEAYTSVYGFAPSSVAAGAPQQTTDDVTRKSFSGFYFAKTLNVSFGVGYPVGKGNRLIIEPFLKYPLDGMGSQQLRFGAGGLNLKLNFTSQKK